MEIWKKMRVGVFFLNTVYIYTPIRNEKINSASHVSNKKE